MKKTSIAIFVCLLAAISVSAQIGVVGGFQSFRADNWEKFYVENEPGAIYPIYGYNLGIDYWFRLKKRRIEFTPELSFGSFEGKLGTNTVSHKTFGFYFFTNIYPFDLASDCDCPVWSKDGNFFTKGFFVQLAPGFSFFKNQSKNTAAIDEFDSTSYSFGGSVGAGLDLGISDFLTITPLGRYYFFPSAHWDNALHAPNSDANIHQFFAGLKLSFRWNQGNKFRR